jgi:cytochrome c7-like protein
VAALYGPGANAAFRVGVLVIVALVGIVVIGPMIYIRTPYASGENNAVPQPVEFDHRHHYRDDGIDCVYCHDTVETEAFAGIPSTARCMGCHAQIWPDSPETRPLRESWRTGTPIRWKRINALPAYVYFHHGVHIAAGEQCRTCHGDVENMPRVRRVHDLTMKFCLDCHRERQASRAITRLTTCTACHR